MADLNLMLSGEAAATLLRLTEEGGFASPQKALETVLRDYAPLEPEVERWLRDTVLPRFDLAAAVESKALSVEEARAHLRG